MGNAYIHGTEPTEQHRLSGLNKLTNNLFLEFLELKESDFVLEVGCGMGILARELAERNSNAQVYGIEYSEQQLLQARTDLPNLRLRQGDAHKLPFADNRFDVVYCRYVLEHVSDPLKVLREMNRVLKPGGKIFLQENNNNVCEFYPDCKSFEIVWKQFILLQEKLGGDGLIGKKLFSLLKEVGYKGVVLSMQPEIHYYDEPLFVLWVDNIIGNIEGATSEMEAYRLVTKEQVSQAVNELKELKVNEQASAYYYWNRAKAVK